MWKEGKWEGREELWEGRKGEGGGYIVLLFLIHKDLCLVRKEGKVYYDIIPASLFLLKQNKCLILI